MLWGPTSQAPKRAGAPPLNDMLACSLVTRSLNGLHSGGALGRKTPNVFAFICTTLSSIHSWERFNLNSTQFKSVFSDALLGFQIATVSFSLAIATFCDLSRTFAWQAPFPFPVIIVPSQLV